MLADAYLQCSQLDCDLQMAEMRFTEAVGLVSSSSKVGGEAGLQLAICVDSQVRCTAIAVVPA